MRTTREKGYFYILKNLIEAKNKLWKDEGSETPRPLTYFLWAKITVGLTKAHVIQLLKVFLYFVIKYVHSQMNSFFLNIDITIWKLFDKTLDFVPLN